MYGSLPDEVELTNLVSPIVAVLKVVTLLIAVTKYPSSKLQPFSTTVYLYAAVGALAKLISFYATGLSPTILMIFEDLCFSTSMIGVIGTMDGDFLWALSSAVDSNALFNRSMSEVDFMRMLGKLQPIFISYVVSVRHLPLFAGSVLAVHVNYAIGVNSCFSFIWYCLWKVTGTSKTEKFRSAYNTAFVVNSLSHTAAIIYTISFLPLFYDMSLARTFLMVTHFLETSVILLIVTYFAFLKAPPSDLQGNKVTNWSVLAGVLEAKRAFKKNKSN